MSNSIIPKVLIAFTQTLISFNIAVNISCLNYYFCNRLWQKKRTKLQWVYLQRKFSSSQRWTSPYWDTHGRFWTLPFFAPAIPDSNLGGKAWAEARTRNHPGAQANQAREPAKSPLPVGLLVEYEGMSWSFTPSTGSKRWNANWLWEWVFSICFSSRHHTSVFLPSLESPASPLVPPSSDSLV